MEVIDYWNNHIMIRKIDKPNVILEVSNIIKTVVPKITAVSSLGTPTEIVTVTKTLPVLFIDRILARKFILKVCPKLEDEYMLVNASHEHYMKNNDAFLIKTEEDFEDAKACSWSNINN